ncbi:MAG: hypothetical protein AAF514_19005, partial [Verrucomicrobiota bacterium]
GNQQLRVNSLRWGLDNWIHAASGGHHAGFGAANTITDHLKNRSIALGSRDFRFRPDRGTFEPQAGPSQFGRIRDDWGNWYGVQNSHPLWHYVLPDRFLSRNPEVPAPDPRRQLRTPSNPRVYPNKSPQKRFHSFEQSGRFTSACGPCIYRDELLFPREPGKLHAFTCEPFHNVVQHHLLTSEGISFTGKRAEAEDEKDFFASADRWSRPVMARTGPDGNLYIVDMYRYMIEHPDWLPDNGKEELKPFYRAGEKMGRIYRIRRTDAPVRPRSLPLVSGRLHEILKEPNGLVRDLAHQEIVTAPVRMDLFPLIRRAAREAKLPEARLQALAALRGLQNDFLPDLARDALIEALEDPSPIVRRAAVLWLGKDLPIEKTSGEQDPKVQLALALTLGDIDGGESGKSLTDVAMKGPEDPSFVAAVLSSAPRHYKILAESLADHPAYGPPLLSMGSSQPGILSRLLSSKDQTTLSRAATWLESLDRKNQSIADLRLADSPALQPVLGQLPQLYARAREAVRNPTQDPAERTVACRLLGREDRALDRDARLLGNLLDPKNPDTLQKAAIENLGRIGTEETVHIIINAWPSLSPGLRAPALGSLMKGDQQTKVFLSSIDPEAEAGAGGLHLTDVDASRRQRLLNHRNATIKALAGKLFASPSAENESDNDESFQEALSLKGQAEKGVGHFKNRCSLCHRVGETGKVVGPDLASLTDKSPGSLLEAILHPTRKVEPNYLAYAITLSETDSEYGLIVAETANSLIVRRLDGTDRTLLRNRVQSLKSTRLSFMPEGLEEGMTP